MRLQLIRSDELMGLTAAMYAAHAPQLAPIPGYVIGGVHLQGRRANQEDAIFTHHVSQFLPGKDLIIAGVLNGHGGPNTANLAQTIVPQTIAEHLRQLTAAQCSQPGLIRQVLKNAFASKYHGYKNAAAHPSAATSQLSTIAERLMAQDSEAAIWMGATAVVLVQLGQERYIANLGDGRAILVDTEGNAIRLSIDQSVSNLDEQTKIKSRGGAWKGARGSERIGMGPIGINVARSLGNEVFKGAIADFQYFGMGSRCQVSQVPKAGTIVLACDGLYEADGVNDVEVAEYVLLQQQSGQMPAAIAQDLARVAIKRGSQDNVSVLLLQPIP